MNIVPRIFSALLASATLFASSAQAQDLSLRDYLQIGSRLSRGQKQDTLEVRLIISPDIRLYAGSKTSFQAISVTPTSVTLPPGSHFKMVDGSVHDVYSGAITLTANFPKGAIACGRVVQAVINTQGCTASLCFPPERIAVSAPTEAC